MDTPSQTSHARWTPPPLRLAMVAGVAALLVATLLLSSCGRLLRRAGVAGNTAGGYAGDTGGALVPDDNVVAAVPQPGRDPFLVPPAYAGTTSPEAGAPAPPATTGGGVPPAPVVVSPPVDGGAEPPVTPPGGPAEPVVKPGGALPDVPAPSVKPGGKRAGKPAAKGQGKGKGKGKGKAAQRLPTAKELKPYDQEAPDWNPPEVAAKGGLELVAVLLGRRPQAVFRLDGAYLRARPGDKVGAFQLERVLPGSAILRDDTTRFEVLLSKGAKPDTKKDSTGGESAQPQTPAADSPATGRTS